MLNLFLNFPDDESGRLLRELRDLQQEKVDSVIQFIDGNLSPIQRTTLVYACPPAAFQPLSHVIYGIFRFESHAGQSTRSAHGSCQGYAFAGASDQMSRDTAIRRIVNQRVLYIVVLSRQRDSVSGFPRQNSKS